MKFTLGIIGAGVMANAILDRAAAKGAIDPANTIIFDISTDALNAMQKKGYRLAKSVQELLDSAENILLAVKPQHHAQILKNNSFINVKCLISIMAGIKIDAIKSLVDNKDIGGKNYAQSPCKIGKGFSAICFDENIEPNSKKLVEDIFSSCGEILHIEESLFDAVTSISGSGPAYIYMFLNGMIKGGEEGGLSYDDAKKMAIATMIGAAELARASDESMDTLIQKVCSKGGTTIEAVEHFRKNNLEEIISDGIKKCRLKSKKLSETL